MQLAEGVKGKREHSEKNLGDPTKNTPLHFKKTPDIGGREYNGITLRAPLLEKSRNAYIQGYP